MPRSCICQVFGGGVSTCQFPHVISGVVTYQFLKPTAVARECVGGDEQFGASVGYFKFNLE